MHHCLQIPEIVDVIVSQLDPSPRKEAKDLATLARTSRVFHEVALDSLWRHQDGLLNLLRCLPAELWETSDADGTRRSDRAWIASDWRNVQRYIGSMLWPDSAPNQLARTTHSGAILSLRPLRPLMASDWNRVSEYAHRVRSLRCRDPQTHVGNLDLTSVYKTVRQGVSGNYLLPNLEQLLWDHVEGLYSSFIDLFLGPRITSLSIRNQSDRRCPELAQLGGISHNLVSVVIHAVDERSSDLERSQLYSFILTLTRVELLEVETLDSEALKHIGQLTTLRNLRLVLPDPLVLRGIPDRSMFSNLHDSRIWTADQDISALIAFLRTWNNPLIKSFEVTFGHSPPMEHLGELYEVLAAHFQEHLRHLKVYLPFNYTGTIVPHPGHFFRPLFAFTDLRIVDIRIPDRYDIDDATISDMACAWPYIEELRLGSHWNRHLPRCTLLGLYFLAQHCPHLLVLEMTFDASNVPQVDIDPERPVVQDKLVELHIGFSLISFARPVATFLASIFTNLSGVVLQDGPKFGLVPNSEDNGRWMEVGRLLLENHPETLEG